ncbi:MAG: 30S ribosomal protein S6 [Candidatus Yanofskybacteria bacterium]|nr:30S ribosomal protein S6 [Candidatus Yanofskybacteria bacterium]
MAELEQKIDNYELGFHLLPELEESETGTKLKEIEDVISRLGGTILNSREPKKQRLSYPLKHKRFSFFGVVEFKSPTEAIKPLENQLKLNDSLLRFLILKIKENQRVLRSIKETSSRPKIRTHTPPALEKRPKEEVKPEEIEKQIEEVITKL